MLHSSGLDQGFYRVRAFATDGNAVPASTTNASYTSLDDPDYQNLHVVTRPDGTCETRLCLPSVHCAACVWLIEKLPSLAPGVLSTTLNLHRRTVRIEWNPKRIALSKIARTLDTFGYPSHPVRSDCAQQADRDAERAMLINIAVSGAIAANVMVIAFALYGEMFHGMDAGFRIFFRSTSLVLTLIALFWPGRMFFQGAINALRTRTVHMDIPIAVGLGAGLISGIVNTLRGTGEVYFESITMLVFLLVIGRWIQHRQRRTSREAIDMLYAVTPSVARVVVDGEVVERPSEALRAGDIVEVRAGETIPADGIVTRGSSSIDASVLTGESVPQHVEADDEVHAGETNLGAMIHMRVEAIGEKTRVGSLMRLVEDAAESKSPIVQLANRVAGVFVVGVLIVASLTFVGWQIVDQSHALENALALLIVTCPCALGLATPLAIVASIGRAASCEILIKGSDVLERLVHPGTLLLDKTGTLTQGRMQVVEWHGDDALRSVVALIESQSAHPVAMALADHWRAQIDDIAVNRLEETTGGGVVAETSEGRFVIGSLDFVRQRIERSPSWVAPLIDDLTDRAISPVLVARDSEVVAIAGVGDPLQQGASETIEELRDRGWRVGLLSGDHPAVVDAVAAELGIDEALRFGGVTPEGKLRVVRRFASEGRVVMVGDGVNDAAALAAADVGIAVHGGAEASLGAADVYLGRPGLGPIVELLDGSKRTMRVIRRNILVSILYNVIGATLAITGLINPLIAAIMMPISSLTVVSLSYRSRTFRTR